MVETDLLVFEKKIWPVIDQLTQENSSKSKINSKKAKIKNLLQDSGRERTRPKSKSSTVLETIDLAVSNKTGEDPEISDITGNKKKESLFSSNKEVSEKIKKNKSLDHVGKLYSKNLSKTTLINKVSNVLQSKNPRTSSHLDLLNANRKNSNESKALFPNILDNYSTKYNFFNYNRLTKLQNVANGQVMAGKSMSFDSLKIFNRSRQLSKCFSVENNKNIKSEKPIGVFIIHKKSSVQTPEVFTRNITNFTGPLFSKENYSNQCKKPLEKTFTIPEILRTQTHVYQTNSIGTSSDSRIPNYQNYSINQSEERNVDCFGTESLLKTTKPYFEDLDSPKTYSIQDFTPEKKRIKICQCLHFHTEDGIKKLTLQNNTNMKEFGQKFFRVNYFSNKEDVTNEQLGSKVKLVDKETATVDKLVGVKSEEFEKRKGSISKHKANHKTSLNKKILTKLKTISKNSLKVSEKKKEKDKKKDNKKDNKNEVKFVLWRNENQMRILGESKPTKKKDSNTRKGNTETKKAKRQTEMNVRRKSEKPLKTLEEISKEKIFAQKILEELEVLEKLFLKLNSTESSLIRRKTPPSVKTDKKGPENKKLSRLMSKKEKTDLQRSMEETCLILTENEAEEKYRRLRNKLRNAIIRHVQNFLNLDFSDK